MNPVRVIVISPEGAVCEMLADALGGTHFDVTEVRPGPNVLRAARYRQPHIAVVDAIDERPEAAELEIAFLKALVPDVQIIALSERSSASDARIIEQGIFYYLGAPAGNDLVRLIEAAGKALTEA